jgi:predicted transcriptional regulator
MKQRRESAKELYLKGETDIKKIALIFGVVEKTVRNWIKRGKWDEALDEIQLLDEEIRISVKRALIKALKQYTANPEDTALQSLVMMLRQYYKTIEPSKDFIQHMKRFLDWEVDYFLTNNDQETAKAIQKAILGDDGLVEYFKRRAET